MGGYSKTGTSKIESIPGSNTIFCVMLFQQL
jgi:hypothetical protein